MLTLRIYFYKMKQQWQQKHSQKITFHEFQANIQS